MTGAVSTSPLEAKLRSTTQPSPVVAERRVLQGGFGSFNVIEVHQGDLRVANCRFRRATRTVAALSTMTTDVRTGRVGRGDNASGTIFVRGSQPVVVEQRLCRRQRSGLVVRCQQFHLGRTVDSGRNTGFIDCVRRSNGNSGPLVQGNRIGTTRLNQTDPSDPSNLNYSCSRRVG